MRLHTLSPSQAVGRFWSSPPYWCNIFGSSPAFPVTLLAGIFWSDSTWDPVNGHFGAWPFVYGTVVTSLLALAISIPIGIGSAIFLAELAPRKLSNGLTFLIELLAAVPSVIYGLIGIFLLIPFLFNVVPYFQKFFGWIPIFSGTFYGVSYFSASVVLSIMVVPFIISISREVLIAVPVSQREAMMALGATKWDVTWGAVVPYARQGIMGSIFLSLARALGETMAVTMVIGNVAQVSTSLMAPGYTIAAVIANEFTEATGDSVPACIDRARPGAVCRNHDLQCAGPPVDADDEGP